jgi:hypothetical protein
MATFRTREYKYKRDDATLIVGIDDAGDVYSFIEKAGKIIARNFLMKMPFEVQLAEKGWIRVQDNE